MKKGYTKCPDCGNEYKIGMPHMMFCPAHTCAECGTSYGSIIQKDPDDNTKRICDRCLEERIEGGEE